MNFDNPYNYIRPDSLSLVSVESAAVLLTLVFAAWLWNRSLLSMEAAYFLALPFSDVIFRFHSIQASDLVALLIIVRCARRFRPTPVLLIAGVLLLFSGLSYLDPSVKGVDFSQPFSGSFSQALVDAPEEYGSLYSLFTSLRFLLVAASFSALSGLPMIGLSRRLVRFSVILAFAVSVGQAVLWLSGFPIPGIFYDGFLPRPKGLAHEPATWAIWILTLLAFVMAAKLRRHYLAMCLIALTLTASAFGFVSLLTFGLACVALPPWRYLRRPRWAHIGGAGIVIAVALAIWRAPVELPVFQKPLAYAAELSGINAGLQGLPSGRQSDIDTFRRFFPAHEVTGIGSFNASRLSAATNWYLTEPVEIGLLGIALVLPLLLLHYLSLFTRSPERHLAAFALNFLAMIAGIRCFAFPELWYAQSVAFRSGPEGAGARGVTLAATRSLSSYGLAPNE